MPLPAEIIHQIDNGVPDLDVVFRWSLHSRLGEVDELREYVFGSSRPTWDEFYTRFPVLRKIHDANRENDIQLAEQITASDEYKKAFRILRFTFAFIVAEMHGNAPNNPYFLPM